MIRGIHSLTTQCSNAYDLPPLLGEQLLLEIWTKQGQRLPGSTRERVADLDVELPARFVITHRYSPSWCSWTKEMIRALVLTPSKLSVASWRGCQMFSPFTDFLSHWYSMGPTPVASTVSVTESIQGMISVAFLGSKLIFGGWAVNILCSLICALYISLSARTAW